MFNFDVEMKVCHGEHGDTPSNRRAAFNCRFNTHHTNALIFMVSCFKNNCQIQWLAELLLRIIKDCKQQFKAEAISMKQLLFVHST